MCSHGALCSIPFNLICNNTTFRFFYTLTHLGVKGVSKDRIYLHGALCSIPFNLTCNMTMF